MDDTGLAARVASGDRDALAVLYARYATPAFSLALSVAGDPQRAADAVQRAFSRLWSEARRFDAPQTPVHTWLLSLVNYLAALSASVPAAPAGTRLARPITGKLCPALARAVGQRD